MNERIPKDVVNLLGEDLFLELLSIYYNIPVDKINLDNYVSDNKIFKSEEALENIYDDCYYGIELDNKIKYMYEKFYKELLEKYGDEESLNILLEYIKGNKVENIKINEFSKSDIFCFYFSLTRTTSFSYFESFNEKKLDGYRYEIESTDLNVETKNDKQLFYMLLNWYLTSGYNKLLDNIDDGFIITKLIMLLGNKKIILKNLIKEIFIIHYMKRLVF